VRVWFPEDPGTYSRQHVFRTYALQQPLSGPNSRRKIRRRGDPLHRHICLRSHWQGGAGEVNVRPDE
jgi:hypothetical protein